MIEQFISARDFRFLQEKQVEILEFRLLKINFNFMKKIDFQKVKKQNATENVKYISVLFFNNSIEVLHTKIKCEDALTRVNNKIYLRRLNYHFLLMTYQKMIL